MVDPYNMLKILDDRQAFVRTLPYDEASPGGDV
jgi:hypothetical protein